MRVEHDFAGPHAGHLGKDGLRQLVDALLGGTFGACFH
jgi:hypothetical protein